ncbi:MAG: ATP-dependent DNA helicase, partial [Anaerolineae bacterium]|nr:ATP-dependent DNA helicase [Anaerolineae bacterium]
AIAHHASLICEAGTGTGKTFAYLVPVLLSGKKVIISTGTKNLQDQLFQKDLPLVRKALEIPLQTALLKGRSNYLCLYRLGVTEGEGRLASRESVQQLRTVREWAGRTSSGDITELMDVGDDSPLWPMVTSTVDNCLGTDCPKFDDCHVMKARREAQNADVLVINHHLLMADMVLREDGFGELLPSADAYIIDEAHQLPEIATSFFGQNLSGRQMFELARDTIAEFHSSAADSKALQQAAEKLEYAVRDFRLALGNDGQRKPWAQLRGDLKVAKQLEAMKLALEALHEQLEAQAERSKGLENCLERCGMLLFKLNLFLVDATADQVYWVDIYTRSFVLSCAPLNIAEPFQKRLQAHQAAWIFTSATLAVNGRFEHYAGQLGLQDAEMALWDSPFDYRRNALFYAPPELPEPNSLLYTEAVVEAALPVLEASRGRAFMLLTSHRALKQAAELLQGRLPYPLLIQGEYPRNELLRRFREHGNAVLLGTGSFWEGVDVRGEALSCVIIDKLPFDAPDDPVLQARADALRAKGGNPFMDYQVPLAVIALKQGVGRLIRDVNDQGVMMLCDPRLISKAYGKVFLNSLPPMLRTRKLELVQRFFAADSRAASA